MLLPPSATGTARRLLLTRALRGFADGLVSVLLPGYLTALGLDAFEVGAIAAGTLLGSAALTLAVGLRASRVGVRAVLLAACALMAGTGAGFALGSAFWPLFVVAVVGTLNPSAGDVSVFLPTEQALLSGASEPPDRTALFAVYNVAGAMAGALGALASGAPAALAHRLGVSALAAQRGAFLLYGLVGLFAAAVYWGLPPAPALPPGPRRAPLEKSRSIVLKLSALFCLDSFGGGFVVQALLALWLMRRFDLPVAVIGAIFFAAGVLNAASQLVSARLAARIGLVETMVYTHLPSQLFLILAALMPRAGLAVLFLLLRAALSSMDVPARQSYVMAVVPPEERAAASSVTNVPRSLAAAVAPLLAGAMLARTSFGWPLLCAGALKGTYDLLLLWMFKRVPPQH